MFLNKKLLEQNTLDFTDDDKQNTFLAMQKFILEKQSNNETFYIGRLSGNETKFTGSILNNNYNLDYLMHDMLHEAGIKFNNKNDMSEYAKLYNTSVLNCDLLGVWNCGMHDQAKSYYNYLLQHNIDLKSQLICVQSLEPYYFMKSKYYMFYEVFKNKKILIVTSHYHTTMKQLENRDNMFCNKIFHETSSFHIYKPPQQNGGNSNNDSWNVHFQKIKADLKKIKEETFDFDIALVSCGGFGMITCDYIKEELKSSVIYVGGALQLYFGIIGSRWVQHDIISTLINNYWMKPLDSDKPSNPNLCEGNCYW